MRPALFAIALAALGQAGAAQEFQIPVEEDWGLLEFGIASRPGASARYRMVIFEQDGKVAVCGAGIYANSSHGSGIRRTMRRAAVDMDGRAVLRNLSFFPIYRRGTDLVGQMATCRVSSAAMDPGADFDVDLPGRVRF